MAKQGWGEGGPLTEGSEFEGPNPSAGTTTGPCLRLGPSTAMHLDPMSGSGPMGLGPILIEKAFSPLVSLLRVEGIQRLRRVPSDLKGHAEMYIVN